jgi:hypothetical protein
MPGQPSFLTLPPPATGGQALPNHRVPAKVQVATVPEPTGAENAAYAAADPIQSFRGLSDAITYHLPHALNQAVRSASMIRAAVR